MSDGRARRAAETVETVTVYNGDTWGLTLGDLRKLVAAADGMPDDGEVTVDGDGLRNHYARNHYARVGVATTRRITVTSRRKIDPTKRDHHRIEKTP